jgi:hypothetical protein
MAMSLHKRAEQSIQNILQVPPEEYESVTRLKSSMRPRNSRDALQLVNRIITQNSTNTSPTPKKLRNSLNYEEFQTHLNKKQDQLILSEEKMLNFLDNNLNRIHTNARDLSVRKRLRITTRCSTEMVQTSSNQLEMSHFNSDLRVSKKDCNYKYQSVAQRSVASFQEKSGKQRYRRKVQAMEDK